MRGRDSIHSGEKGEKKVEQVRVIARSQGTLTGLEFLPRKRLEKVRKEGGGRDEFESRNKILIFVTISAEMRLELGGRKWATVGRKLELCLHTIMQREDRDTVGVKEGEEKFGEAPRGGAIMEVLYNAKGVAEPWNVRPWSVASRTIFRTWSLFINIRPMGFEISKITAGMVSD